MGVVVDPTLVLSPKLTKSQSPILTFFAEGGEEGRSLSKLFVPKFKTDKMPKSPMLFSAVGGGGGC